MVKSLSRNIVERGSLVSRRQHNLCEALNEAHYGLTGSSILIYDLPIVFILWQQQAQ
jgi:hypothetical protein